MEILFSAIARAGGVEIPADKRIFPAEAKAGPLPRNTPKPRPLRTLLGRLFQSIGKRTEALGERLLAGPSREAWRIAGCD